MIYAGPYQIGEVSQPLNYTFQDQDGEPIPIDGFEAVFQFKRIAAEETNEKTATVKDDGEENTGQVEYEWEYGDLDTPGTYMAYFYIDNGTNRLASVPFRFQVYRSASDSAPSFSD